MLQAYPSEPDPVVRALRGELPMRVFSLMVRNLPMGNPAYQEIAGSPWGDTENLLWDISARLRDLLNMLGHFGEKNVPDTEYLPRPEDTRPDAHESGYDGEENRRPSHNPEALAEREDLLRTLAQGQ